MAEGNEHYREWLDTLSATDLPQVTGALRGAVDETGKYGYCCLGVACTMAPDGDRFFGGAIGLLPPEVAQWMGLEDLFDGAKADWEALVERATGGLDVQVDYPFDGPPEDDGMGGTISVDLELSAATLNDEGFTFAQIADVFRYFGVKGLG